MTLTSPAREAKVSAATAVIASVFDDDELLIKTSLQKQLNLGSLGIMTITIGNNYFAQGAKVSATTVVTASNFNDDKLLK